MIGAHDRGMTEGTFLTFDSNMRLTRKGTLISTLLELAEALPLFPFPSQET